MIGFTRDGGEIVAALEQTEAQVFGLVVAQVAGLIEYDRNERADDSELGANFEAELNELEGDLGDDDGADQAADRTDDRADDFADLDSGSEQDDADAVPGPGLNGDGSGARADAPYVDGGLGLGFDLSSGTVSGDDTARSGAHASDDPVLARLFPDGYRDDAEAAAELRGLIQGDLHTAKLDHANTMLATLPLSGGEIRLDSGQAESWLLALNDARLALGTRLGVTDDMDVLDELDDAVLRDPAGPRVLALSVYHLLGYAQETLVEALID